MPALASALVTPYGVDIAGAWRQLITAEFGGNPNFQRWHIPSGLYGAMAAASIVYFTSAVVATRFARLFTGIGVNVSGLSPWDVRSSQSIGASELVTVFFSPEVQTFNQGAGGTFQSVQIPYYLLPPGGGWEALLQNNQAGDGIGGNNVTVDFYPWGQAQTATAPLAPAPTPLLL